MFAVMGGCVAAILVGLFVIMFSYKFCGKKVWGKGRARHDGGGYTGFHEIQGGRNGIELLGKHESDSDIELHQRRAPWP